MLTVNQIAEFLQRFAPVELAEDWDNVGLLVGDGRGEVSRVMTCLTITPASAAEAVRRKANLIITHHPLPFHALKRLTTETPPGTVAQVMQRGYMLHDRLLRAAYMFQQETDWHLRRPDLSGH